MDDFLRASEYSSHKELVGLTVYYLEHFEGSDKVTAAEVADILSLSRVQIGRSSVAARITGLRDDGLLKKAGTSGRRNEYYLTLHGIDKFEELAMDAGDGPRKREDRFIDTDSVDASYYAALVQNINDGYQYGINDATLILTRKLFENLLIDIFRAEFGKSRIELFYNTNIGQFRGLGSLCGNLEDEKSEFDAYSRQIDDDLIEQIEEFREQGNTSAHSVRVDIKGDELDAMSEEATELTNILYDIREEVRIANGAATAAVSD